MIPRIVTTVIFLFVLNLVGFAQTFQWVQSLQISDYGDLCESGDGNVFRCGSFGGTLDFDDSGNIVQGVSQGQLDAFIQKVDENGSLLWLKTFGGVQDVFAFSVRIDSQSNIYVAGGFNGNADFDPGNGVFNKSAMGADAYILKLNANGEFLWVRTFEGSGESQIQFLEVKNDEIYFAGTCDGDIDLNPDSADSIITLNGPNNLFMGKMDAQGNLDWAHTIDGPDNAFFYGMNVDNSGSLIVSGDFFDGSVDFDPSNAQAISSTNGNADAFILKLSIDGDYLWHHTIGGTGFDYGTEIYVDAEGNIYQTGAFSGTVDFDPTAGTDVRSSNGYTDFFLQKYSEQGSVIRTTTLGVSGRANAEKIQGDGEFLYLTGVFDDTVDLNPAPNAESQYVSQEYQITGASDYFLMKMDTMGNHIWSGQLKGAGFSSSPELTITNAGDLYYTGSYLYDFDANPGANDTILTTNQYSSSFLLKLGDRISGNDEIFQGQLRVYPNPFENELRIDGFSGEAKFEIIQMNGQVIRKGQIMNGQINELDDLSKGVYFLNIYSDQSFAKMKIVK